MVVQLVEFIIGLVILIILHELGHFLAARLFKVEVEEFGLGFPPRAMKLFESGGTIFSLNWIPLGGFVRLKGENDPSIPGGLAAANPLVRLGVLVAGPAMNLLIGLALGIALFYSMGDPIPTKVKIQMVAEGSPAEVAGIQAGDIIIQANGENIDSVGKLQEVIGKNLGKPVNLVYQRGDQQRNTSVVPRNPPPPGQGAIGVVLTNPTQPITLFKAVERGGAAVYQNIRGILLLPIRVLGGQASEQEARLVGYKGMFEIYQQVQSPLWFFMAITISLGVINLFPIPALDGGRILLTLPEMIIRKRIPANLENTIHLMGFALLLILLVYINLQDFLNPIQLP